MPSTLQIMGLAGIEAVLGLLEVVSLGVVVDIVGNLVDPGQGVQNTQVGLAVFEHGVAQGVDVFHLLVFHQVGKPLALHAGHVENVGLVDNLFGEVVLFGVGDTQLVAVDFVFFGHLQLFGSHKVERGVEVRHGHEQ